MGKYVMRRTGDLISPGMNFLPHPRQATATRNRHSGYTNPGGWFISEYETRNPPAGILFPCTLIYLLY